MRVAAIAVGKKAIDVLDVVRAIRERVEVVTGFGQMEVSLSEAGWSDVGCSAEERSHVVWVVVSVLVSVDVVDAFGETSPFLAIGGVRVDANVNAAIHVGEGEDAAVEDAVD